MTGITATPGIDVGEVGADEGRWRVLIDNAALSPWQPGPPGSLLVVSPHPDDETLAVGGCLHDLVRRGWQICLAAVTDGEAAYPEVSGLASVRQGELMASLDALGVGAATTLIRLGLPDGAVAHHAAAVEERILSLAAGAAWILAPWPADGHPDHQASGRAARSAARRSGTPLRYFPVWAWHWMLPTSDAARALLAGAERWELSPAAVTAKYRALEAFVSQRSGAFGPPILPPHIVKRFLRPFEVLIR